MPAKCPLFTRVLLFACALTAFFIHIVACAPLIPEKPDRKREYNANEYVEEQEYYDKKYAGEPEPPDTVSKLVSLLETCVGGQYVIGGQGDRITADLLSVAQKEYPGAFTKERIEYLSRIARSGETEGWDFPRHYAWDCSGLWWWGCNKLGLYPKNTDCTAYITYHTYCTPISKDDLRPGDLVFYKNKEGRIVHMGIIGKKGYVFEAVSVFGGVVKKRTVDQRIYYDIANGGMFTAPEWNVFGRPKIFR